VLPREGTLVSEDKATSGTCRKRQPLVAASLITTHTHALPTETEGEFSWLKSSKHYPCYLSKAACIFSVELFIPLVVLYETRAEPQTRILHVRGCVRQVFKRRRRQICRENKILSWLICCERKGSVEEAKISKPDALNDRRAN
jgi:hypothetical protein